MSRHISLESAAVLVLGAVLGAVFVFVLLLVAVLVLLLIHLVHMINLQLFLRSLRLDRMPAISGSILCLENNAAYQSENYGCRYSA